MRSSPSMAALVHPTSIALVAEEAGNGPAVSERKSHYRSIR